ncbi:MAG: Insertion element protein [Proteobacteria bacterium]|nr:Insertion element protein [Pseudomonadota bacterium]
MIENVFCPRCDSDAIYRYGHTKNGKQRYLCLLCSRQFIKDLPLQKFKQRTFCPLCGGNMHIYKRERVRIRFRCARYPHCHGYTAREVIIDCDDE